MTEILYTLIFTSVLMGGVYAYAVYATRSGIEEDENNNFIPDSWKRPLSGCLQVKS